MLFVEASTGPFVTVDVAVTVTADGWIEVTVTVDGWMEVTVTVDCLGEKGGMELGGFKPILSLLALFVILHQLHTIVVGLGVSVALGVAVEEGDEIATTLDKWVIVG